MADAAEAFARYDYHLGLDHGALAAYREHVEEAFAEALDDDLVAQVILRYMASREEFEGTVGELLAELNAQRAARWDAATADAYWPGTAGHLMRVLPRSGPLLARMGVMWTDLGRGKSGRRVRLKTLKQGDAPTDARDREAALTPAEGDAHDVSDAHFSSLLFDSEEREGEEQAVEAQQEEISVTRVTAPSGLPTYPVLVELAGGLHVPDVLPMPSDDPWTVTT